MGWYDFNRNRSQRIGRRFGWPVRMQGSEFTHGTDICSWAVASSQALSERADFMRDRSRDLPHHREQPSDWNEDLLMFPGVGGCTAP